MRRIITLILIITLGCNRLCAELLPSQYREEVVAYSRTLERSSEAVSAASEGVALARVAQLPNLSAAGSYAYHLRHYDGRKDWSMTLEPRLIQTLYGGGVVRASVESAQLEAQIAVCDEAFTLLEVVYAADYAYWNLWAMSRLREAMAQYVDVIEQQTKVIERRYTEGYTSKGDLLMMSSRLSEARYELISAEQSMLTSRHNLNTLRGLQPDEEVSLRGVVPDSLFVPQRITPERLIAQRVDYAAARLNCDLRRAATKGVRGAYNPQLVGGVGAGWRSHTPNTTGRTFVDGTLFVELSVPIYHFGERRRAVARSRSYERVAQAEQEMLRDEIVCDESNAWVDIVESRAQMSAATRSLNIASENLSISTYSYNEGLVSVVDLMTAQISWMQNYTNAITAEYDYQIALSTYRRVVGDMAKNRVR